MTRIAVIGEAGQLARRLAMLDGPHDCVFLGRDQLDFTRPETIAPALAAARADVIVNAAAYTAVDAAEDNPVTAHAVNAEGPGVAARAARALGAAFVQISTDYVYDGSWRGLRTEADPTGPVNVYGASKLAGERAVAKACPRSAVLRTAWLYAPEGCNFVKTMLRMGATRNALRVVDDQRGSPTFAGDLAAAILAIAPRLAAARAGDPAFGVFNAAGDGAASWADFAEAIFTGAAQSGLLERAPRIERIASASFPTPAARPANTALNCDRLADIHGVRLSPWRAALSRALAAPGASWYS